MNSLFLLCVKSKTMKKLKTLLFILTIIIFPSLVRSQSQPDGLFAYIYIAPAGPAEVVAVMNFNDTTLSGHTGIVSKDMVVYNNLLLCGYNDIVFFDPVAFQHIDTIYGADALLMEVWGDNLVVISGTAPLFRIYNLDTKQLTYSHDSTWFPGINSAWSKDLAVYGDFAAVTYDHKLCIVDLKQLDTIPLVTTPDYFFNVGYNLYVAPYNGSFYIVTDYATGAPRFNVVGVDTLTWQVDSLFVLEFLWAPLPPVFADEALYISKYNTHYDLNADTLFVATDSMHYPVAIDPGWSFPLLYNTGNHKLMYGTMDYNLYGSYMTRSLYFKTVPIYVESTAKKPEFYVTPTFIDDNFCVSGGNSEEQLTVTVYSPDGKKVNEVTGYQPGQTIMLEERAGVYVVVVRSGAGVVSFKVVKR